MFFVLWNALLAQANKNTKTLTQVDNECRQQQKRKKKYNTGTRRKLFILFQNGFFPAFD